MANSRLVREALAEREVLWRIAPHMVRPLRFVLPVTPGMRARWILRAGLFLYDRIGGRTALPRNEALRLDLHPAGAPLAAIRAAALPIPMPGSMMPGWWC